MPTSPTIDTDLPCHNCHYNLRTLSPESLCPECGQPIADSILRSPVDPLWLAGQSRASLLFVIANAFFVLGNIVSVFHMFDHLGVPAAVGVGGFRLWLIDKNNVLREPTSVAFFLVILGLILNFIAHVSLIRRNPRVTASAMDTLRRAILILTILNAGLLIFRIGFALSPNGLPGFSHRKLYHSEWFPALLAILDAAQGTLLYLYVYRLAKQLKHRQLAMATFVVYLLVAIPSLFVLPLLIRPWLKDYKFWWTVLNNFDLFALTGIMSLLLFIWAWAIFDRDAKLAAMA